MRDESVDPRVGAPPRGAQDVAPDADGSFERHRPALEAVIRRHLPRAVRRRVSVADVVQETRIVAHRRRGDFRARREGDYLAWLLRIAELKAREAFRAHAGTSKRAVAREGPRTGGFDVSCVPAAGDSPSEGAMGGERRARVLRALDALSPDHREVIRLVRIAGLPIADVALRMERSEDAVKRLYGRALARLGEVLGSTDGPPR